jgi:drug/metabolite transporter (DMT)-like permease
MSVTTSTPTPAIISTPVRASGSVSSAQWAVVAAIIAWAFAAIFVRYAHQAGMPSLIIAAGRLGLATLILTPFVWRRYRDQFSRLTRRDVRLIIVAGIWVGGHFAAVTASLEHASVMIVNVFTALGPVWVVLLERIAFRTMPTRIVQAGILCALSGAVLVALSSSSGDMGERPLLGAFLAGSAAGGYAVYMLIGRSVRSRMSMIPYVWMIYGVGSVVVLIIAVIAGVPLAGFSGEAYFWLALVTIFPQLIGHSAMNYAIAYLSPTYISVVSQISIVLSSVLALIIFREIPVLLQVIGGAAIICGALLANIGQRRRPASSTAETLPAAAGGAD